MMIAKRNKKTLEGKITVYPYANNKLKGVAYKDASNPDEPLMMYPLYIRVIVKQQTTSFASMSSINKHYEVPQVLYEVDNIDQQLNQNPRIRKIVDEEIRTIKEIVTDLDAFEDDNFDIKDVVKQLKHLYEPVSKLIKHYLEREIQSVISAYPLSNSITVPSIKPQKDNIGAYKASIKYIDVDNQWFSIPKSFDINEEINPKTAVWTLATLMPSMEKLKEKHSLALWCYEDILRHVYNYNIIKPDKKYALLLKDWKSGALTQNLREAFALESELIDVFIEEVNQIIEAE